MAYKHQFNDKDIFGTYFGLLRYLMNKDIEKFCDIKEQYLALKESNNFSSSGDLKLSFGSHTFNAKANRFGEEGDLT